MPQAITSLPSTTVLWVALGRAMLYGALSVGLALAAVIAGFLLARA